MYLIQQFVKAVLQSTLKVEGSDVRDCFVENALMDRGVFLSLVKCSMHAWWNPKATIMVRHKKIAEKSEAFPMFSALAMAAMPW